jgi:DNA-binding MarR family transcriptional regulator
MHPDPTPASERLDLEWLIGVDLRDLTSESGWIAGSFSEQNNLSANEFRALLFVILAESSDRRMTAGDLREKMGLSGAAITYLVDRMVERGHLSREADPTDRRRVFLRYTEHGRAVAHTFFGGLAARSHAALAVLPDSDLEAAHRVLRAMITAMTNARAASCPIELRSAAAT